MISFRTLLLLSVLLRVFLIIYGEWQDSHMEVRYTDIDYFVFSDAASLMASGLSPYKRSTYRYSPLLAFLLIPNSIIHHSWGKIIFSASDLLVGVLIRSILKLRRVPENLCTYSVIVWLLNPFTFTIGTRGNCEPIVCAMVLWIIICLLKELGSCDHLYHLKGGMPERAMYSFVHQVAIFFLATVVGKLLYLKCFKHTHICASSDSYLSLLATVSFCFVGEVLQAALWYGLVVHFRIYPIIYALPIIIALDPLYFQYGRKPCLSHWRSSQENLAQNSSTKVPRLYDIWIILSGMFTRGRIVFGLVSGAIFFACTGLSFYLYRWEFLHEALLYHLTRTDPRHNFSIYFYHLYLHMEHKFSVVEKLISFLPQFMVQLVLVYRFAQDLPFCFFVQTVAFVAFNKVITAQYFVWFFCLLPLILPWSNMKLREGVRCSLAWIGAQVHWLMWGYLLEFKGKNVFLQLWLASLLFFAANTYVLIIMIRRHRYTPVYVSLQNASSWNTIKQK